MGKIILSFIAGFAVAYLIGWLYLQKLKADNK
jgi:biotin transporter BioY